MSSNGSSPGGPYDELLVELKGIGASLQRVACALDELSRSGGPQDWRSDDLTAHAARRTLESAGELLTRAEAAAYTRRAPKTFDRTIRATLRNLGTERRPLFLKKDIDEWLRRRPPGPSDDNQEASASTSVSPIKASVMRNPRARANLEKLRGSRPNSTQT